MAENSIESKKKNFKDSYLWYQGLFYFFEIFLSQPAEVNSQQNFFLIIFSVTCSIQWALSGDCDKNYLITDIENRKNILTISFFLYIFNQI